MVVVGALALSVGGVFKKPGGSSQQPNLAPAERSDCPLGHVLQQERPEADSAQTDDAVADGFAQAADFAFASGM